MVDLQPQFLVGHVLPRQEVLDRQVEREPGRHLDRRPGLLRLDRVAQHRVVELEADGRDGTVLLDPQQVPRPADLEIFEGQLESRSQVVQLGDDIEPLVGVLRVRPQRVVEEIGVGPLAGTADPPTQLIELRQPHTVGVDHHDGVRVGDVEPRFDDRRANQHVGLALDELHHHVGERRLGHLSMADHHPRLRHQPLDPLLGLLDRLHPVVHIEDLAPTL